MTRLNMERLEAAGKLNQLIRAEADSICGRVDSLCQTFRFPLLKVDTVPLALILGNHSSGKSSLINHLLGQHVQKTGRAPTDHIFTFIAGGNRMEILDGNAIMRNKRFQFSDLEQLFGPEFVSQVELKIIEGCSLLDTTGMMIIDSPGMIDPPGIGLLNQKIENCPDLDRGYHFKGVVKWLADKADVILLMFDPDKPGTTYETLDVLTSCLAHVPNKVQLVLNKVDDFRSIHDFARAYGTLCWNLSKDMPNIYTMYIPQEGRPHQFDEHNSLLGMLTHEFDGTREEVIYEISRAAERSSDNILSSLRNRLELLEMHCLIIDRFRTDYLSFSQRTKMYVVALGMLGITWSAAYILKNWDSRAEFNRVVKSANNLDSGGIAPKWENEWAAQQARAKVSFRWSSLISILSMSGTAMGVVWRYGARKLSALQENPMPGIAKTFELLYEKILRDPERRPEVMRRWLVLQPNIRLALECLKLDDLPPLTHNSLAVIKSIQLDHIPRLNRSLRDRGGDDYKYLEMKYGFK